MSMKSQKVEFLRGLNRQILSEGKTLPTRLNVTR